MNNGVTGKNATLYTSYYLQILKMLSQSLRSWTFVSTNIKVASNEWEILLEIQAIRCEYRKLTFSLFNFGHFHDRVTTKEPYKVLRKCKQIRS